MTDEIKEILVQSPKGPKRISVLSECSSIKIKWEHGIPCVQVLGYEKKLLSIHPFQHVLGVYYETT